MLCFSATNEWVRIVQQLNLILQRVVTCGFYLGRWTVMEIHVIHIIAVYKSLCFSVLIKTCSLISNIGLVKQKTEGTNEGAPTAQIVWN